jgi:hypothetical protein
MTKEREYRAYAGTCVDLAKKAPSDKEKKHLLAMAEAWLGLADRVRRPVPEPDASSVHPALRAKFGWWREFAWLLLSSQIHIPNPLHGTALGIIGTGRGDYHIAGSDMPTLDDCKRKAEICLRWADEAANNEQRDTLLEIAALWTQMELSCADPNKVDEAAHGRRISEAPKS